MNLSSLISRFRTEANDKVVPYFWQDSEVTDWLNDAVSEAAIRGRLIFESGNTAICRIDVVAGQAAYPLHSAMYEIVSATFSHDGDNGKHRARPLPLVSVETLDQVVPRWRTESCDPRFIVQTDSGLRIAPAPIRTGVVWLEGYRLPLVSMVADTDEPEINAAHHRHLVNWALHKAFSIPDTESFDPNRSVIAEAEFIKYFGIRPDSDLRRITREDYPHHVQPFWV